MRDTIIRLANQRGDDWGDAVRSRVENTFDLVAAEARYHRECFAIFSKSGSTENIGRPEHPLAAEAFTKVCDYIDNSDECQHTVGDLLDVMLTASDDEHVYTFKHMKKKLCSHYSSNITITELPGKISIATLKENTHRILTENWYAERKSNVSDERMRVVKAAAAIIREDIRAAVCEKVHRSTDA